MKPETKFKNRVFAWLKTMRKHYPDQLWWVKLNDRTTEGLPDVLLIVNGTVTFWELKIHPNVATPLQRVTINKINKAGGMAKVLYEEGYKEFQIYVINLTREEETKS